MKDNQLIEQVENALLSSKRSRYHRAGKALVSANGGTKEYVLALEEFNAAWKEYRQELIDLGEIDREL